MASTKLVGRSKGTNLGLVLVQGKGRWLCLCELDDLMMSTELGY